MQLVATMMMMLWASSARAFKRAELINVGDFTVTSASLTKTEDLLRKTGPIDDTPEDDGFWMSFSMSMAPAPTPKTPSSSPAIGAPSTGPPPPSTTNPAAPSTPAVPTSSPAPSSSPPPTAWATVAPTMQPRTVYTCCNCSDAIDLAEPPYAVTTYVDFKLAYEVESEFGLEAYEQDLELQILAAAVMGALQCNQGGPIFGPGGDPPIFDMTTTPTDETCDTVQPDTTCTVYESNFTIVIDEAIDPDFSAFLGYVYIQDEMDSGHMVAALPLIDRLRYLRPAPLPPPITGPEDPGNGGGSVAAQGSLSVSPWTLGAVLAMCIGGVVALWVWARNRRTRNQRHMQLLEDGSMSEPQPLMPEAPRAPA